MVLIIISWCYILFTAINLGVGFDVILKLKIKDFLITAINGLFVATLLTSIWAIFGRINIEFHLVLLLLNLLIFFKYRNQITESYRQFWNIIQNLVLPLRLFLSVITVLIIAQCTTAPFVIDNETYYLQTIKWFNEYGLVKGLANLHISLGQCSGWHLLQSAFSFSFLYQNFNDLSGFCLLIGNCFSIIKLNDYFQNHKKNNLIVGLFPIANVLFFQLISAPSPDIPVYVFSFILFFYFIEKFENPDLSDFTIITILTLFILYIKATTIGLALIPLIMLAFHFKRLFTKLILISIIALVVLCLFVVKNAIASGMPLFPLSYFKLNTDYAVPENLVAYYFNSGKLCMFFVTLEEYHTLSFGQIALKWLFASKISGMINSLTVLILIICPYFIYRFFNQKSFWILYIIAVVEFVILLLSSPVYRYFIYITLFFGLLILVCIWYKKQFILIIYASGIIVTAIALLFPINYDRLTQNKLISKNSTFSLENIIFPHQNSKLGNNFKRIQNRNLNYNSLESNPFFWATGNGDIPCVNQQQIDYLEQELLVVPQLRTTDLKDGFYTKSIQ